MRIEPFWARGTLVFHLVTPDYRVSVMQFENIPETASAVVMRAPGVPGAVESWVVGVEGKLDTQDVAIPAGLISLVKYWYRPWATACMPQAQEHAVAYALYELSRPMWDEHVSVGVEPLVAHQPIPLPTGGTWGTNEWSWAGLVKAEVPGITPRMIARGRVVYRARAGHLPRPPRVTVWREVLEMMGYEVTGGVKGARVYTFYESPDGTQAAVTVAGPETGGREIPMASIRTTGAGRPLAGANLETRVWPEWLSEDVEGLEPGSPIPGKWLDIIRLPLGRGEVWKVGPGPMGAYYLPDDEKWIEKYGGPAPCRSMLYPALANLVIPL